MPRPNPGRSIASEANLAKRIAFERESRGLSYEGLASLMTARGCAIQGSAIYKIEKGNPPRRVTVDELIALKEVFETTTDDLLLAMEVLRKERAAELASQTLEVFDSLPDAVFRLCDVVAKSSDLWRADPELHEYYRNLWDAESKKMKDVPLPPPVVKAITALINAVTKSCSIPEVAAEIRRVRAARKV
jgi:transcriptional regulator with XRE-family HTH domain